MPRDFGFLKEGCLITGADWSAIAGRESGSWQLLANHQVGKQVREALLKHLSNPDVDSWLCGALTAGRPRSRALTEIKGLEKSILHIFPIANTFTVILVCTRKEDSHLQGIWKMAASLQAQVDDEKGVSLLQSELLLPNPPNRHMTRCAFLVVS
jgi:hypothetical protein